MAFLQDWLRRPQRLWFRRALFQVHLWTGIGVGLYIVAVCVSGSAAVFRAQLTDYLSRPRSVAVSGARLSEAELGRAAARSHPGYTFYRLWPVHGPREAVEIWLDQPGTGRRIKREFNPYTGKDLGDRTSLALLWFDRLIEFHGDLGFGDTGRIVNGAGGFLVTLLCLTGMVIWWPGAANWRHSVRFAWRGDWRRFLWELHSTVGFWTVLLILLFAPTGAYLVFTSPFERAINAVSPLRVYGLDVADDAADQEQQRIELGAPQIDPATGEVIDAPANGPGPKMTWGDELVRWAPRLHYGRFAGAGVEALWVILGLAPPLLFCTGALMWWKRVVRPAARRAGKKSAGSGDRRVEIPAGAR